MSRERYRYIYIYIYIYAHTNAEDIIVRSMREKTKAIMCTIEMQSQL